MLNLTVAQDGSGDYASISEAVLAVPYELEAEITIGPGVYRRFQCLPASGRRQQFDCFIMFHHIHHYSLAAARSFSYSLRSL